jgi:hypothetical protein
MTTKEKALKRSDLFRVFVGGDFERESRSLIISLLDDNQKLDFMNLARREQDIYVKSALREMGLRKPAESI